jgi:hypothetical protein
MHNWIRVSHKDGYEEIYHTKWNSSAKKYIIEKFNVWTYSELIYKYKDKFLPVFNCHEDVWGSEGIAPPFLTSALDGSEW